MKREQHIAELIQKNRMALLRLVSCWLFVASFFDSSRKLPRRVSTWAFSLVCAAEEAAHLLIVALSYRRRAGYFVRNRHARRAMAVFDLRFIARQRCEPVFRPTVGYICMRLNALKTLLGNLDAYAGEIADQRLIWCAFRLLVAYSTAQVSTYFGTGSTYHLFEPVAPP